MLVGGVIDHEVHDHLDAALVRFGEQLVHVIHRAEDRVDGLIVGNVIAIVVLRRLIDRAQPDHIHAEIGNVIESARDALEIADAVAVRIPNSADKSGTPPRSPTTGWVWRRSYARNREAQAYSLRSWKLLCL